MIWILTIAHASRLPEHWITRRAPQASDDE